MVFKEGDKIITSGRMSGKDINGLTGTVKAYKNYSSGPPFYEIKFDNGLNWGVYDNQVKLQEVTDWRARMNPQEKTKP